MYYAAEVVLKQTLRFFVLRFVFVCRILRVSNTTIYSGLTIGILCGIIIRTIVMNGILCGVVGFMISVSTELINEIRECINEPYINNRLRLLELEKWLCITSALDTLEDASSAIDFYVNSGCSSALGELYLHVYGLLQALYVSQECIVSLRKSLLDKGINFKEESPDLYYVRNVRDDILHATDRGKVNKSYIYLTQIKLSKSNLEYYKQSKENFSLNSECVNVIELIDKNNGEVNKYLEEVKNELNEELEVKKEKFSKEKLADLFGNLNFIAHNLTENTFADNWAYEATREILQKYKSGLDERYVSWKECDADVYEIDFIEKIYNGLDKNSLDKNESCLKDILIDDLLYHFKNLENLARDHDDYCLDIEHEVECDGCMIIDIPEVEAIKDLME